MNLLFNSKLLSNIKFIYFVLILAITVLFLICWMSFIIHAFGNEYGIAITTSNLLDVVKGSEFQEYLLGTSLGGIIIYFVLLLMIFKCK